MKLDILHGTAAFGAAVLLLCTTLQASAQEPAGAEGPSPKRITREGIAIDFTMERLDADGQTPRFREGDTVRFRFDIADVLSETPLSSVYPAAWMDLKPDTEHLNPDACREKVEAFIGGSLLAPPELDLNTYYVLALNDDASISVVDPLFGFGNTKLLDMVFLAAPGEDWLLTPDGSTLFVSMPEADQVAVVDTASWEVTASLDVGPRPGRLELQPDGRYLWVVYEGAREEGGASGVTVVDAEARRVVADVATGRGEHDLVLAGDRAAFITNRDDGTLSVVDVESLREVAELPVGDEPVAVAHSELGEAVYVVDHAGGIVVIDAESRKVGPRIEAEPGLTGIFFEPGGRLGFVVNPERDLLHLLDAASNRIVQSGEMEDGPDQVAFSDELAYVRHRGSELVLMIPLDQVGVAGRPIPLIDFPGGHKPFGEVSRPSPAASIVQAPGATAVLVANPADQAIYFYKEGMAAPMGHFRNYRREPRAVLAVDRSLRETRPGRYETTATLRRPGTYDVAFFLDTPRVVHCFEVEVAADPTRAAAGPAVELKPRFERRSVAPGERLSLTFEVLDRKSGRSLDGLEDLQVLTFRAPGHDQRRQWAEPVAEGVYGVEFSADRPGAYYVFARSQSMGLSYAETPFMVVKVERQPAPQTR